MGCGESAEEQPLTPANACSGCEKVMENPATDLRPYCGKLYCHACVGAIIESKNRAIGTLRRTTIAAKEEANMEVGEQNV